jgi:Na+/glutamate symporter
LALFAANLPFFMSRFLGLIPIRNGRSQMQKSWPWHLLELCIMYALVLLVGKWIEHTLGQRSPQGWEFYAITVCLFFTCAFPGFVYRYLWKG